MSKQGLNYFASRVQGGGFGGPMLVVPSPAGFDVFSDAGGGKVEDQHYQIEYERIDSEEKLPLRCFVKNRVIARGSFACPAGRRFSA